MNLTNESFLIDNMVENVSIGSGEDAVVMTGREIATMNLKQTLVAIEENDPSSFTFAYDKEGDTDLQNFYDVRNSLVYQAVYLARMLGYKAGFCVHDPVQDIIDKKWDHRWGVVAYIELPTGQVSWHIESPDVKYDGHTYVEKNERIQQFVKED